MAFRRVTQEDPWASDLFARMIRYGSIDYDAESW